MQLFHPRKTNYDYLEPRARELMKKTIEFFENKGKKKLKDDDHNAVWYDDFLQFVKESQAFAILMTPKGYGADGSHWNSSSIVAFNEIVAFYGLAYWYTWQVSMLGIVPIFMSQNEDAKQRAAKYLQEGHIFAFGLSERAHGADLIASEMTLFKSNGGYKASGRKYYIGNGNKAKMVSTFAKVDGTRDYAFVVVDSSHENYKLIKNVIRSQSYVAEYELQDYPISENDVLYSGRAAWDASLSTVAVCKYNLGWASIGICTHSFYEALNHAANRRIFNKQVTDFPHIQQLFVDAYCRLLAMRLFSMRAKDYMRTASADDRRYLLFNPMVKMKVTMQGEDVINHLWDVIAARGFEKDMYFEMAARDIRALPKLEGTAHVNMVLVVKFINGLLFNHSEDVAKVPVIDDDRNDDFMLDQGATTKGLDKVQFQSYEKLLGSKSNIPNIQTFLEQVAILKSFFEKEAPAKEQSKDLDFMLTLGEIFTLVPYAMLVVEEAEHTGLNDAVLDMIFNVLVRDFSKYAVELHGKTSTSEGQQSLCLNMIKKPSRNGNFETTWQEVMAHKDSYVMND